MRNYAQGCWYHWSFIALFVLLSSLCMGDINCSVDDDDDEDTYVTRPDTPDGPEEAEVDVEVEFTTGGSESSTGGTIEYRIDFGDGETSDWAEAESAQHTYADEGNFPVSAQAKCKGITSSWSSSHYIEIVAPKPLLMWQAACEADDGTIWIAGKRGYMACYHQRNQATHAQIATQNLNAIASYGDRTVACGDDGTLLQKIGKQHWQPIKKQEENLPDLYGVAIYNNFVVVVGSHNAIWQCNIPILNETDRYNISDHLDWQIMGSNTQDMMLYGVWLYNEVSGFAVGAKGTILYWNGQNWLAMPCPTQETLHAVWGSNNEDVWAVGQHGTILHFNGSSWQLVSNPTTANLRSIHGIANQQLWIAADDGSLLGTRLDSRDVQTSIYPWQTMQVSFKKIASVYLRHDAKQMIVTGDQYKEISIP